MLDLFAASDLKLDFALFADGGSRGNPGPAACGFVLYEVADLDGLNIGNLVDFVQQGQLQEVAAEGLFLGSTTNNVAEWEGLLCGLRYLDKSHQLQNSRVKIFLDSQLVIRQCLGEYKVKQEHLKPKILELKQLQSRTKFIEFNHVYRELNKTADALVNQVLDANV